MEQEKSAAAPARREQFEEFDPFRGWNPFRELGWPRFGRFFEPGWVPAGRSEMVAPAVDIHEQDEKYVITAELPGIKKEDVTVESQGDMLTIRGEKRSEREEKKQKARWVERSYGSFSRSFTLPADVATDRVAASFKDGVLTIEIPKTEEKKAKVISVR